jgi:hypothetical protein
MKSAAGWRDANAVGANLAVAAENVRRTGCIRTNGYGAQIMANTKKVWTFRMWSVLGSLGMRMMVVILPAIWSARR